MSAPRKIFFGENLLRLTQLQTAVPRTVKRRRSAENGFLAAARNQPTRNWPITQNERKACYRNELCSIIAIGHLVKTKPNKANFRRDDVFGAEGLRLPQSLRSFAMTRVGLLCILKIRSGAHNDKRQISASLRAIRRIARQSQTLQWETFYFSTKTT